MKYGVKHITKELSPKAADICRQCIVPDEEKVVFLGVSFGVCLVCVFVYLCGMHTCMHVHMCAGAHAPGGGVCS